MKYSLKLTLTALFICSFATPSMQAMDRASLLFDSNTKKLIWALTAIIITSFATNAHEKLYSLISQNEENPIEEVYKLGEEPIWGLIPEDPKYASAKQVERARSRRFKINRLLNENQPNAQGTDLIKELTILNEWIPPQSNVKIKSLWSYLPTAISQVKMLEKPQTQDEYNNLVTKLGAKNKPCVN